MRIRRCVWCDEMLPIDAAANRKYCGDVCKHRAFRARNRAQNEARRDRLATLETFTGELLYLVEDLHNQVRETRAQIDELPRQLSLFTPAFSAQSEPQTQPTGGPKPMTFGGLKPVVPPTTEDDLEDLFEIKTVDQGGQSARNLIASAKALVTTVSAEDIAKRKKMTGANARVTKKSFKDRAS